MHKLFNYLADLAPKVCQNIFFFGLRIVWEQLSCEIAMKSFVKKFINIYILIYLVYFHHVVTKVQAFMNLIMSGYQILLLLLMTLCKILQTTKTNLKNSYSITTNNINFSVNWKIESTQARSYNLQRRHSFTFLPIKSWAMNLYNCLLCEITQFIIVYAKLI